MKLELIASPFYLRPTIVVPHRSSSPIHSLKRRRLKKFRRRSTTPTMSVSVSLEGIFHGIVSGFRHINSLELIVPTLGFVSGTAIYLSSQMYRGRKIPEEVVARDWILFSSPTPFNRSVLLRCPALSFAHGAELLDGVSEQIVREERHFVNLESMRVWLPVSGVDEWSEDVGVRYQRVCIRTDDGGVIAIDWPENLHLDKEQGFNTTVLLVPGSARGSLDGDVMSFVQEALRHGFFPVVMNPRGCARSPIITPRLFTAADSDDIATAVQFVKQSRPWTTLMCVGWGYGSNMLTKYLSESGEEAAITATICIDSPFDLDEITKSYPHCVALDQKLAHGFMDILQANKEIFQGKDKRFDVAKALSATTVREFEEAISMISYGYESIKDFYVRCNVRNSASKVRTPLLFIQSDESITPFFSIPRDSIAENPYTSLLMPSGSPSNGNRSDKSTVVWCHLLAIEWLQAIELSLLKGRHPLLEDLKFPLKPSYDFPLLVTSDSEKMFHLSSLFSPSHHSVIVSSHRRLVVVDMNRIQENATTENYANPSTCFFHVLFKGGALAFYILSTLFANSFVIIFVITVLLAALDFWIVKNVSGRILVGLRWWNEINEQGVSIWKFECLDQESLSRMNKKDSWLFWWTIYLSAVAWVFLGIFSLIRFEADYLLVVGVCLSLNIANIVGFTKCRKDAKKQIQQFAQQTIASRFTSTVQSAFSIV